MSFDIYYGADLAVKLDLILKEIQNMAAELDALKAAVAQERTVEQSALVLINGFAARLQAVIDAGGKPADFQALATSLKTDNTELAAAVLANTPPPPGPNPTP